MKQKKIAQKILVRIAADFYDPNKLVHNPNPRGVKEMVTQEYANKFLGGGSSQKSLNPLQPHLKHRENKKRVEVQRKTNIKHRQPLSNPAYNKKGSEVTEQDCKNFIKEFHKTFQETAHWQEGLVKAGAKVFSGRLKDEGSLFNKMQSKFKDRSLNSVGDVIGSRAVCNDLKSLQSVVDHIYKNFDVLEHDDSVEQSQRANGYRAHHFTIKGSDGKLVELQVKTQNQKHWAKYTHDRIYKSKDPEIIAHSDQINAYTKALSDHIHELDKGNNPGKAPEPPEILKRKNILFNEGLLRKSGK